MKAQIERALLDNYEKYYRVAYSYVRNEQDALDVVQDSAYKAIKNWRKVKEPQYIDTWIYRIVTNTALNLLKKQKNISSYEENLPFLPQEQEPFSHRDEVLSLLDHLDETERTILILRFFEELKIDQIARIIQENPNTTKSRLYRALQKLRKYIDTSHLAY